MKLSAMPTEIDLRGMDAIEAICVLDRYLDEAMRANLEERGIPADQILEDNTSTSTQENLRNAAELLKGKRDQQVAIVTSDYHVPRALAMAKDQGLNATGISSPTLPEYWLKNHGRETLGWMKYLLQKYLHLPLERE